MIFWNPPEDPDDSDGSLALCVFALVMVAVVVIGQMAKGIHP